jgi:hypothetical protein
VGQVVRPEMGSIHSERMSYIVGLDTFSKIGDDKVKNLRYEVVTDAQYG